jgi:hypothetical protein
LGVSLRWHRGADHEAGYGKDYEGRAKAENSISVGDHEWKKVGEVRGAGHRPT